MKQNLASDRSGRTAPTFAPSFHGDTSRRLGNIRAVSLEGSATNTDQIFGMTTARESIEAGFGQTENAPQPDVAGKRDGSYVSKDNIINAFGRTKGIASSAFIILIGLATLTTPACAANRNVESVLASQSDLSLFYQALLNTGVANELKEDTEYTIFAPTNAAFTAIQPRIYPCFYSAQCRVGVAAILRNHIVPRNESVNAFSKWGGNHIPTLGDRELFVEETYKDQYTVEGHSVLHQSQGDRVSLYPIDGVIAGREELSQFRTQAVAEAPGTVTEKTVTTYRTPATYPGAPSGGYAVPGGAPPPAHTVFLGTDEWPDNAQETTTTVTRSTTTE